MKQAGGKSVELSFKSNGEVLNNDYDLKNGNNPYYQWGRKDPMLPGDGITAGITASNGKDKTCYPSSPEYKFKYGSEGLNTNDIKEYIRNPHKFNVNSYMDGQYYNLWSTDNDKTVPNDEVVIKTVYDPSPVGYSIPAVNAFTGFTNTGQTVGNYYTPATPEQINAKQPFDKGWYFYCKPNKQGGTIFFPASGYRYCFNAYVHGVKSDGAYWVAGPHNRTFGRFLNYNSTAIVPLDNSDRGFGWSVRSAEEKVLKCGLKKLQMMFGLREVYDA